ncbi:MAG: hypothetical protein M5U15_13615 [Kiritimatiellae bacterium]|nr:hypothetical protein [Kiritimatiellia bacterium]
MEAMVILVCITGGVSLLCALGGWGLDMPELVLVGYIVGTVCGALLAIVPLFVWAAVRRLHNEIAAQRRR